MPLILDPDRPPIPPADLILRVAPGFDVEQLDDARRYFDVEGLNHLRHFETALAGVGRSFEEFDRILDFGCGCGRFLRHLRTTADAVEIHGTDVDAEAIAWVAEHLPYVTAGVGAMTPPLPYPDDHFDLVVNHSVFTHLDEASQDLWLAELRRLTRPGGLAMLTFEGPASWNRTSSLAGAAGDDVERWRDELETRGILVISDDHFIGSTHAEGYHSTVHAPWYVLEHWGSYLDVVAYLPQGSDTQDMVVLRARENDVTGTRPIGRRGVHAAPSTPPAPPEELDPVALTRQLNMLRAAIYEQGKRISVSTAQLREEIAASRAVDQAPPPASPGVAPRPFRRRLGRRG